MKNKRRIKPKKICMKTIFWIVVVCIMFVNLVPLLWMLSASFKTIVDIMNPKKMFVFTPTIKNYIEVFTKYSFLKPIINSLIVSTGATVLACLFGLPADMQLQDISRINCHSLSWQYVLSRQSHFLFRGTLFFQN